MDVVKEYHNTMGDIRPIICAGFVTYNPDIELLKKAVISVSQQVSNIIIIDNNSLNIKEIETLCADVFNVKVLKNDKNLGIATALNQIATYASDEGFKWFLTLDQDSECPSEMIERYAKITKENDVAIVCPIIHLRVHGDKNPVIGKGVEYIDTAITSGCLVRVEAWKQVGGFWDFLFIDKVDDDFCYSLREKGWRIARVKDVILLHQIGNPSQHKILGKSYYIDSYPPFRYFYIARNNIIVYHLHKNTGCYASVIIFKKIIKIILGENKKNAKLNAFIKGIFSGCYFVISNKKQCFKI